MVGSKIASNIHNGPFSYEGNVDGYPRLNRFFFDVFALVFGVYDHCDYFLCSEQESQTQQ